MPPYPTRPYRNARARSFRGLSDRGNVAAALGPSVADQLRDLAKASGEALAVANAKAEPFAGYGGGGFGGGGAGGSWGEPSKGSRSPDLEFLPITAVVNACAGLADYVPGMPYHHPSYQYLSCGNIAANGGWFDNHYLAGHSGTLYDAGGHACGELSFNTGGHATPEAAVAVAEVAGRTTRSGSSGAYRWGDSYARKLVDGPGPLVWTECVNTVQTTVIPWDGDGGSDSGPDENIRDPEDEQDEGAEDPSDPPTGKDLAKDLVIDLILPPRGPPRMIVTTRPNTSVPPAPPVTPPGRTPTREHKLSLRGHMGRAWLVLGQLTEAEDVIKALHAALPPECRVRPWQPSGRRSQARDMLGALMKCADHIDTVQAIENLLNEQIEDIYYGNIIGKPGKWINQKLGLYTGGNWLVSAASDEVLPAPPKIDLGDDSSQWWLFINGDD